MAEGNYHLKQTEHELITELFKNGIMTVRDNAQSNNKRIHDYLRNPYRVDRFLKEMFNYRINHSNDCLLLIANKMPLATLDTQIVLASIQAIIDNNTVSQTIGHDQLLLAVNQVLLKQNITHDESSNTLNMLADRIKTLLIDQFHVLSTQNFVSDNSADQVIENYYIYNRHFFDFATLIVQYLSAKITKEEFPKNENLQRFNQLIMTRYYLDNDVDSELWKYAQQYRGHIASTWENFPGYTLEMTNEYAILLNENTHKYQAKAVQLAIVVSKKIPITGYTKQQLSQVIDIEITNRYPNVAVTVYRNDTWAKLKELHLIKRIDDLFVQTTLVPRFEIVNNRTNAGCTTNVARTINAVMQENQTKIRCYHQCNTSNVQRFKRVKLHKRSVSPIPTYERKSQ
ncbi:hypothetical protein IWT140_00442 [Secundilactobacillus pentosiphilus]|uniref:Uncharacterized protein n=1 Tax=Secundilactobacillus pentosiphilus TaxID=1714682 RepID=A0A1Z5IM55_9LACO|nr:hypothetical protein [Secundilactobacillus pentosiphilus]GAX02844.1 hypothetical protein IWT140_00442 [Secundilactobacillus pentosiphilus]